MGTQTMQFNEFAGFVAPGATPVTLSTSGDGVLVAATYQAAGTTLSGWLGGFSGISDLSALGDDDHDGIPNLLEYAFNLHPGQSDRHRLDPGSGVSGLPAHGLQKNGNTVTGIQLEWLQRKNGGLSYSVERSATMSGNWDAITTPAPNVTDIDGTWQRATLTVPPDPSSTTRTFVRIKVTTP